MSWGDSTSPAELFYGRKLCQNLPMLPEQATTNQDVSSKEATLTRQAENTAKFEPLQPGQQVFVQHPLTKKWKIGATIEAARQDRYSDTSTNTHQPRNGCSTNIKFRKRIPVKIYRGLQLEAEVLYGQGDWHKGKDAKENKHEIKVNERGSIKRR